MPRKRKFARFNYNDSEPFGDFAPELDDNGFDSDVQAIYKRAQEHFSTADPLMERFENYSFRFKAGSNVDLDAEWEYGDIGEEIVWGRDAKAENAPKSDNTDDETWRPKRHLWQLKPALSRDSARRVKSEQHEAHALGKSVKRFTDKKLNATNKRDSTTPATRTARAKNDTRTVRH